MGLDFEEHLNFRIYMYLPEFRDTYKLFTGALRPDSGYDTKDHPKKQKGNGLDIKVFIPQYG